MSSEKLKVLCPECGRKYAVPAKAVGRKVRCRCGHKWRIEDPNAMPSAEDLLAEIGDFGDDDRTVAMGEGSTGGVDLDQPVEYLRHDDEDGPRGAPPGAKTAPTTICPECGTKVDRDAVICIKCGYNRQTGRKVGTSTGK